MTFNFELHFMPVNYWLCNYCGQGINVEGDLEDHYIEDCESLMDCWSCDQMGRADKPNRVIRSSRINDTQYCNQCKEEGSNEAL